MSNCTDTQLAQLAALFGGNSTQAQTLCDIFATNDEFAYDSPTGQSFTASNMAVSLAGTTAGLNVLYLVVEAALVFVMHAGFAMLCAGAIRSKNTMNILLQTILDACVSAVAFYTVGYAFAYGIPIGSDSNGFIGNALFGLARWESHTGLGGGIANWQNWVFQWAFAATATTIPAGAVAERFNFNAYLGYSFFIASFVYPVVVHWAWCPEGWMNYGRLYGKHHLFGAGYIDFAGSGVVHMVGGLSGMVGCIMVGPRMGRFDSNGQPVDMPGHSATLVVLGTVLLWFGWYGFNPGSMLNINTVPYADVVGRAAVTTTLSGAMGGLVALASAALRNKAWDLVAVCNGVLVGFVTITAGCHVLEPWAALIVGGTGALIFDGVCALFLKFKIDDPLSAAPMHGFTGMWGVFFVGLLAKQEYIYEAYSGSHHDASAGLTDEEAMQFYSYGCFYPGSNGKLIASQCIGIICIFVWTVGLMTLFFIPFKLLGALRISAEEEQAGLDVSKHGGSAYNYENALGKAGEKTPGL